MNFFDWLVPLGNMAKQGFSRSVVILMTALGFSSLYAERTVDLSLAMDVPLVIASAGVGLGGRWMFKNMDVPGDTKSRSQLFPWDRPFAGNSSRMAGDLSNLFLYCAFLTPALIWSEAWYDGSGSGKEFGVFTVMFLETLAIQSGLNLMVRSTQLWPRPYTYKSGDDDHEAEAYGSFYSGHASAAFSTAVFIAYSFNYFYPNSSYFPLVTASSFALASGVGALRIVAGRHFLSDVIVGGLAGATIAYGVIKLHETSVASLSAGPGFAALTFRF